MSRLRRTLQPPTNVCLLRQTRLRCHPLIFRSRATTLNLLISPYRAYATHPPSTSRATIQALSIFHQLMLSARCRTQTETRNGRSLPQMATKTTPRSLTPQGMDEMQLDPALVGIGQRRSVERESTDRESYKAERRAQLVREAEDMREMLRQKERELAELQ
jgi:hypothetical protein